MSTIVSDLVSHLQCGVAIAANDSVYISNVDGKIYKYDPLDPTLVYAGIAKEAGLLNAFIRVVQSGRVKGFTGLTPGKFVYASVTVPGGFQLTEPGATSKVVLGIAKSATELTVNGALGIKTGGDGTGSGSLDTILQLTATEQLTDWSTGNNATVLGGGVLAGSFVKETSTPLHGPESYKYTQAAGSLNDYFLSKVFPVDIRFRTTQVYLQFPYKYDGATGDIEIVVYDATNSVILSTSSDVVQGTNNANQSAIVSVNIPLTCASIRVGFQTKVLNSGKIFQFDDIQLSSSLYQSAQLNNVTDWVSYTPTGTWTTNTTYMGRWRRNGGDMIISTRVSLSGAPTGSFTLNIPNGNTVDVTKLPLGSISNSEALGIALVYDVSTTTRFIGDVSLDSTTAIRISTHASNTIVSATAPFTFAVNDVIEMTFTIPIQGWTAGNTAIVTPTQQISSDTLPFTFKATAIVDADPIGTFNTYTYAANTNTATISASAPTQTVASMNANGVQVFGRAYNAASTTASPTRIDIKIGKGLKATSTSAYLSTGKATRVFSDLYYASTLVAFGTNSTYDEITGILTYNAGVNAATVTTRQSGIQENGADATSAYFVFNASTTPSISALPVLQPRIATLSDVKASGTAGGSAGAATTQTRVLNTLVDPTGIVTSLVANQFILQAGTYYIEASAPAALVSAHKIRIRNITDSTTSLIGSSEFIGSTNAAYIATRSMLAGEITITSAKTFELQHYTTVARATDGLGGATSSGESETYGIVTITKVR